MSARVIGPWSAVALVVANMFGAGVFTISGFALQDLGRPGLVMLAWLVGGLVAMAGALSYGALGRRMPESGGEYTFLSETLHPMAGFVAGWISLLAGFAAPIAASGLALSSYLGDALQRSLWPEWTATATILLTGLMHGLRVRPGLVLQNVAVACKLLLVAVFLGLGIAWLPDRLDAAPAPSVAAPTLAAFATSVVWISFAYSGWNAAIYVAGEIRDPARRLAPALVAATGVVTLIYLALNGVFLYSAPVVALAGKADIGAAAAQALGGPGLRRFVSVLVAIALFSSISSMVMAASRVSARMSNDGLLPGWMAPREGGAPGAAVVLQVALALLLVWVSNLAEILGYAGFTLGLCAAATVAVLMTLHRREGRERVPLPGYPWLPGAFVLTTVCSSAAMALHARRSAMLGLLTVSASIPVYAWIRRRARRIARRGAVSE